MMHLDEKTLSHEIIFEGKVFTVARDSVELENNTTAFRELVLHHGGAGILPVDDDGNTYLVKQYRAGARKVLTEICAGKLEPGESPLDCACRELSEELGLVARDVTSLGYFEPTPAYDSEVIHLFLARGICECERHLDEDEFVDIVKMPLEQAIVLVQNGTLTDGKTQIALLKAKGLIQNGKN